MDKIGNDVLARGIRFINTMYGSLPLDLQHQLSKAGLREALVIEKCKKIAKDFDNGIDVRSAVKVLMSDVSDSISSLPVLGAFADIDDTIAHIRDMSEAEFRPWFVEKLKKL